MTFMLLKKSPAIAAGRESASPQRAAGQTARKNCLVAEPRASTPAGTARIRTTDQYGQVRMFAYLFRIGVGRIRIDRLVFMESNGGFGCIPGFCASQEIEAGKGI
jgi:hypothetical protein